MNKNYQFSGVVVNGDKIGTKIGFPTLNIQKEEKIFKEEQGGVFIVEGEFVEKEEIPLSELKMFGVMHIGPRPTLEKEEIRYEIHIFKNEKVLSNISPNGKKFHGKILHKIRNVKNFKHLEELKTQIKKDIQESKKWLLANRVTF